MSGQTPRRAPRAYRIEGERIVTAQTDRLCADEPERARIDAHLLPEQEPIAETTPMAMPPQRSARWIRWLAIGCGGLISLSLGLAGDALIRDLFDRALWLGWLGLAFAAIAVVAALAIIVREARALARLKAIDQLRQKLEGAARADDGKAARSALAELGALYAARPDTAHGRAALARHMREIIDGRDIVVLGERELLAPLDARARRLVANASRRVSVITALSPRAFIDLAVVAIENLRLIRAVSMLYGGRPGTLGALRLVRHVLGHLALTGGMSAGDSLLQQAFGHGLAAKISARLGEGVINGLLTARIGAAAIDVCRPSPFIGLPAPRVTDFVGALKKAADEKDQAATTPAA